MKKILAIILALVMVLSLCACGQTAANNTPANGNTNTNSNNVSTGNQTEKPAETNGKPARKDHYVIYDIVKIDGTYFLNEAKGMASVFKAKSEEYGFTYDFHYIGTDNDPEKHMTAIENAIADKADVIITCVPDQTMSVAVKERCDEAGVLLIAVDDGLIDENGNKIAPWRGIAAYDIGYAAGEWGAKYILENNLVDDPACGILLQTMDTVSSCVPRTEGELAAIKDILGDKMNDRIWRADYQSTSELAYESSSAVMAAHPEITKWVIMNASENGTEAASALVEELGLKDSVIVSLGADQCALQWPVGNYQQVKAATYFSGIKIGMKAAEDVIEYLWNGTELELEYAVPAIIVNSENYKEHYINPEDLVYDNFL